MSNGPARFPHLVVTLARGRPVAAPEEPGCGFADVFNQVLQPLILVLAFVALFLLAMVSRLHRSALPDPETPEASIDIRIARVNQQLALLMEALAAEEAELRVAQGFAALPDASRVQRAGIRVDDEQLRRLCGFAVRLADEDLRRQEWLRLYRRVLERAGVRDLAPPPLRVRAAGPVRRQMLDRPMVRDLSPGEHAELMEVNDVTVLAGRNRRILQNAVLNLLEGLREDARGLERQLVKALVEARLESPEMAALDPESRELVLAMMDPKRRPEDRRTQQAALLRRTVELWRAELDGSGYQLVVWDEILAAPLADAAGGDHGGT